MATKNTKKHKREPKFQRLEHFEPRKDAKEREKKPFQRLEKSAGTPAVRFQTLENKKLRTLPMGTLCGYEVDEGGGGDDDEFGGVEVGVGVAVLFGMADSSITCISDSFLKPYQA